MSDAYNDIKSSLPLQVALYYNKPYVAIFFVLGFIEIVYKGAFSNILWIYFIHAVVKLALLPCSGLREPTVDPEGGAVRCFRSVRCNLTHVCPSSDRYEVSVSVISLRGGDGDAVRVCVRRVGAVVVGCVADCHGRCLRLSPC